jgi:DNA-binding NarL/FixJ family response regulator
MSAILIVDRQVQTRHKIRETFAKSGDNICAEWDDVWHVEEQTKRFEPDLVILGLPDESEECFQLLESLKASFSRVPVFVVLDKYDYRVERRLLKLGVAAVFRRDKDPAAILKNARAICQARFG